MEQNIVVQSKEELEECLMIRKEVFVQEQQVPLDLELDEYDESPTAALHILIRVDGEPGATGRIIPYDASTAKMQRIAVKKSFRGIGLGKRLLAVMEQQAREKGFTSSVLDAQVAARVFYEKSGYRVVSEKQFLDAGIPHVRMKKENI